MKRANGSGTVYKLQGHRRRPWIAAKNRVIIGYYETKKQALAELEKTAGRELLPSYNMKFSEVYEHWSQQHYREITNAGITSYKRAYDVFSPLHDRKFRDLRTYDYQQVIDSYLNLSYSSLSKFKQLITQMSSWAIQNEIITVNFASYVKLPKEEKHEKKIFTADDIEKFKEDDSETAKIVLMLIYTGLRIGELFSLPVADYHGDYLIGGEKTESGRNRVVPIRPDGREYFAYFARIADGPLLLSGYSGHQTARGFREMDYYPLLARLNIEKLPPHTTRHTYASWASNAGVPPDTLQKILGHANYSTTAEIYVHKDIQDLINAVDVASKKDS